MKMRVGTHRAMYPWIDIKAKFLLTLFSYPLVQEEQIKKSTLHPTYIREEGENKQTRKSTDLQLFFSASRWMASYRSWSHCLLLGCLFNSQLYFGHDRPFLLDNLDFSWLNIFIIKLLTFCIFCISCQRYSKAVSTSKARHCCARIDSSVLP